MRPEQIAPEPEPLPNEELTLSGLSVLRHTLHTHGITYLNLYFAADDLNQEDLQAASLLCELLGALATGTTPAAALPQKLRTHFGSLQSWVESYGEVENFDRCRVFLCVSASMLNSRVADGAKLLSELLQDTRLDDWEKMWEILRQRRTDLARQIAENGNSFAITRSGAAFRTECAVQEYASGIAFLQWLRAREAEGPAALPALADRLQTLMTRLFTCARLTVSVTSDAADVAASAVGQLADALPAGLFNLPARCTVTWPEPAREGFVLPSDISFAAMSGPFPDANRGAARVMKQVVYLEHLWGSIRVRGGAYGTSMILRNNGLACLSSYRDPNAAHSLACYQEVSSFLERYTGDVTGAILGAVAENDPLRTPRDKGKAADAYYWKKLSHAALCRSRQEILSTTTRDVAGYAAQMRDFSAHSAVCVLGPRRQLEACGEELDTILSI